MAYIYPDVITNIYFFIVILKTYMVTSIIILVYLFVTYTGVIFNQQRKDLYHAMYKVKLFDHGVGIIIHGKCDEPSGGESAIA